MMEIFYETKDVYLLKDLEKIAPKSKGITPMSVKDVVMSLVDDGLVDSEKIGTSIYFWAFPSSKASQARKAKLEKVTEERDKIRERLATMKKEAQAAEEGREETEERTEAVANLEKALEER